MRERFSSPGRARRLSRFRRRARASSSSSSSSTASLAVPAVAVAAVLAVAASAATTCRSSLGTTTPCAAFAPFPTTGLRITRRVPITTSTILRLSSNPGDDGPPKSPGFGASPSSNPDNLSASARARREEDRRRALRRDENVPGRTSAKPGERDYAIDPAATERLYLSGAGDVERKVYLLTEEGMDALRTLQLEEANEAFTAVYSLKPDAYLWQAGVVQYYLNDLRAAADTFASNAALYETKFMCPASEERIWRDACQLRIESTEGRKKRGKVTDLAGGRGAEGAREGETAAAMAGSSIAQVPEKSGLAGEMMSQETRKVIRIARDLFSASVRNDRPSVALSRAKLRSITGNYGSSPTPDRKMWRLNSWYYLGLHYDAVGDSQESKKCMKMALRQSAGQNGASVDGDIIRVLPLLHMARRDWFDDDDFEEDEGGIRRPPPSAPRRGMGTSDLDAAANRYSWSALKGGGGDTSGSGGSSERDAVEESIAAVRESIAATVDEMKLDEMRDALKRREIKSSGSKAELRRRLVDSLLREAGFE